MLLRAWHRIERSFVYNVIRLFRVRSASEHVARGFAVGLIVNFFPTFGFGVLISGFIAKAVGGSAIAGLVGGALLTFFWPALFYLNLRVGTFFLESRMPVDEVSDVTERTLDLVVWGRAFTVGAVLNSLIVGLLIYTIILLTYSRVRPIAISFFRRHARDHQKRFRRLRASVVVGS